VKIRLSIHPLSNPWRRGLTILEMLVSTAMLSFIVLGLTAMLIQTQKAFKTGIKQNTITDAGRSIMDMIAGDLAQMSDAQNTNVFTNVFGRLNPNFNFYWDLSTNTPIVNYIYSNNVSVPIRTNELNDIFILEHTNTAWIGVGYAVSNYPGVAVGTLYRYEASMNTLVPLSTNDLFAQFSNSVFNATFTNSYWHQIADGVIDLRISAFDQFGNENDNNLWYTYGWVSYPIGGFPLQYTNVSTNTLPNSVELEFGILEPDTLIQARGLVIPGNPTPLANFLSSNAAPKMEVFRQRITIPAASR